MSDSLVIIPSYNELENIEAIIDAVFKLPKDFHVLVVDDNSPDGTAEVVKALQNTILRYIISGSEDRESWFGNCLYSWF